MAEIVNMEFPELAHTGLNYLSWSSDCEIWFEGKNLLRTIGKGTLLAPTDPKFAPENAQALHFLRHHLFPTLKDEYMVEWSASVFSTALKQRFERLKYTVKPRAEAKWIRVRFADFKTVGEYNSVLHRICTTLQLCGTEITDSQKIEKTLSTFHPDAVQYSELIDILQVAEAQDEVLEKNFVVQPLGGSSRQEVNALKVRKPLQKKRGCKPQDWFRCGSLEHFSRQCYAPKEVVAAYKAQKEHDTHLALVQEESPLAPPVAPVMISTPPHAPIVATSAVPIAATLAVSNDIDAAMEFEHTLAPMVTSLDVDVATKMMFIEEGITGLEIQAEGNGFFAKST
ncbi:hypothetical protein ZWY2020_006068 [Hordeum vulgare]|nr:hypothetical protein ZWY2020_006068 [Hordeum vulgare]